MDRIFKSKVDWWYHFLIFFMLLACIFVVLGQNMIAIVSVFLITIFILHVFLNTYYVITKDGKLEAKCGIFPKKTIDITEIEALEPTIFPTFSYALSLDRMIIWKDGQMWMLVSPKNEKEFIKQLRKINPNIQIKKNEGFI